MLAFVQMHVSQQICHKFIIYMSKISLAYEICQMKFARVNGASSWIVLADKTRVKPKIKNSLALSLRCDSSVDRGRIDNCHVLAKIIDQDGKPELLFLGLDEPKARGTPRDVLAVKDAVNLTSSWSDVASKMTSFITDRINLNTEDKTSLWPSLTSEHEAYGLPLLKVWCIADRPDLAWKAVSNNVTEVKFFFSTIVAIASYFHSLRVRSRERRDVRGGGKSIIGGGADIHIFMFCIIYFL